MNKNVIKRFKQSVEGLTDADVGSGYGAPGGHKKGELDYFLIIFKDNVKYPEIFEGYKVIKRTMPVEQ